MGIMEIVGIISIMEMRVEVATLLEHGPVGRVKVFLQSRAAPAVAALLVGEITDGFPLKSSLEIQLKDYHIIFDSA